MMILLTAMLVTVPAAAVSLRAETRADWRSLDCVARRLQDVQSRTENEELQRSIQICLLHVDAMLVRHGGVIEGPKCIPIDDPARLGDREAFLVMAQHGHADSSGHWNDLLTSIGDYAFGRFKRWLHGVWWSWVPWIVIAAILWFKFIRRGRIIVARDEEQRATHTAIEHVHPDKKDRASCFSDPLIHRAHQRMKM